MALPTGHKNLDKAAPSAAAPSSASNFGKAVLPALKKKGPDQMPFTNRQLLGRGLNKACELQNKIVAEVGSEQYLPLPVEAIARSVKHGLAIGGYVGHELVGVCIAFPEAQSLEFLDGRLPPGAHPKNKNTVGVCYFVSHDYRGSGMTKAMLKDCLSSARAKGYHHAVATVAPDNGPGIKVLLDSHFVVSFVGPVYQDLTRYVGYHQLNGKASFNPVEVWRPTHDISGQQELLQNGYFGIAAKVDEKLGTVIGFAKSQKP